ncbi:MAG: DUF3857 domain-containing transglutaminase family protein [Saprospiraceae bacterium]
MKRNLLLLKVTLCLVILTILTHDSSAQDWNVMHIPDTLKKDAMIVTRMKQEKIEVLSKDKFTQTFRHVFTIFSENENWEENSLHYNSFIKINNLKLTTYDASGLKIKDYGKKDFKDYSVFDGSSIHSDGRQLYLSTQRSEYPYTVDISYSIEYESNLYLPNFWIQRYGEAVQNSNYELVFSRDSEVTFKSYNLPFSVDSIHTEIEPKKLKFAWNFKDLYAIKGNAFALPYDLVLPHISCISSNFTFGKTKGSSESWETFSKFIYDLNATQGEITPEMSQLVKDLTQNATNDFEKIDAIYQYVKSKMRYVAVTLKIGGLQSFEASFVHKNFYGECKALTNYTKVLLQEAGIESYAALIYNGDKRASYLDPTFSQSHFNHVVLYIPSQDLWLECTSKSYPTGYLGSSNEGRYALLIKESGGALIKTKSYDETINVQEIDITIQVHADDIHEVTYSKTLQGEEHEAYRSLVNNADKDELEKYFVRNLDQTPIRFSSLDIQYEKDKPVSTVKAKFYISKIGTQTGNRFFLNANPIEKLNFYTDNAKEERKGPFYLQNHSTNKLKITYILPPGYQMESKPIQTSAKESDFGKFEVSSAMEENKYVFTRDFVTKPGIFEGNRYKEMMDFRKEYNKLESSKAVFIKP